LVDGRHGQALLFLMQKKMLNRQAGSFARLFIRGMQLRQSTVEHFLGESTAQGIEH
jgi:hypothetical protein